MPKYQDSDLNEALRMVDEGSSVYNAAKTCNVPKSTIHWRIQHKTPKARGRKTKLSADDENELVKYAEFMSDNGTPVTPTWLVGTGSRLANIR